MGKNKDKAQKRLDARRASFDGGQGVKGGSKKVGGYKRPGSLKKR